MTDVNWRIKKQLKGEKPHKLSVDRRSENDLLPQLCIVCEHGRNVTLAGFDSLTVDGCAKSIEELQTLLYTTPVPDQHGVWIHGDACRATILNCESHVNRGHTSTMKGSEFKEGGLRHGETNYSGTCTLTLTWEYQDSKPPIEIVAKSSYAKYMWDPRA